MLLIKVAPPIFYVQTLENLEILLIASRLLGDSLFPVSRWPIDVYVTRLLVDPANKEALRDDEFTLIAWGELYASKEEAAAKNNARRKMGGH
jgi:hypothetical protein